MKLITETFINNVELIDKSEYAEGRTRFWHDLRRFMSQQLFANIQFDKKLETAGAYFQRQRFQFDRIYMPEESAELILEGSGAATRGSLRFVDDYNFGLFLHEASHYLHMIKDGGRFLAPSLNGEHPKHLMNKMGHHSDSYTIDIEYEAGYRSLMYSSQYNMYSPTDRTILELNLSNMLHYITILNRESFEGCDPEVFKRRVKEWKETTESFEDISDYMTVV